jgi:hypothetical protein
MTDRQARHPALLRQHRHGYAAGFHRGLPTGETNRIRSWPPPGGGGHALHPGPYPPDLSRWNAYRALNAGSSRMPSRLACRTRAVWQYRHVPSLSGLLPPPRRLPVQLPSASAGPLRRPGGGVLSPPHGHKAPRGARLPRSAHARYGRNGRPFSAPEPTLTSQPRPARASRWCSWDYNANLSPTNTITPEHASSRSPATTRIRPSRRSPACICGPPPTAAPESPTEAGPG